jgi:hypothetical protein
MRSNIRLYLSGRFFLIGLIGLSLALTACATTRQRRSIEPSGFLGNYSDLRKEDGQALLIYINPATDFSQYRALIIDSVTGWRSDKTANLSAKERQALTDYLYLALQKQLGEDYEIVNSSGVGVMRLRAAITEAEGAKVMANTVTTVVPQLRVLTTLGGLAADPAVLVAEAGLEVEITDSLTGERLAAAADRRAGTKTLRGGISEWSHVEEALDFWVERLRKRLAKLRAS